MFGACVCGRIQTGSPGDAPKAEKPLAGTVERAASVMPMSIRFAGILPLSAKLNQLNTQPTLFENATLRS